MAAWIRLDPVLQQLTGSQRPPGCPASLRIWRL